MRNKYLNLEKISLIIILFIGLILEYYILFYSYFSTELSPIIIRLVIISSFYIIFLIYTYYHKKNQVILYSLFIFLFILFINLYRNKSLILNYDLIFLKVNPLINTVREYVEQNKIIFSTSHNSYFLTYYIIYIISILTKLEYYKCIYIFLIIYIFMIGSISIYFINNYINDENRNKNIYNLLLFYFISSNIVIIQNRSIYRDIGIIFLTMHLLLVMQDKFEEMGYFIINLILIIGSAISSPLASMIIIILYFIRFIFERKYTYLLIVIIPASYFVYIGQKYYELLIVYGKYATQGLIAFIIETIFGEIPDIEPWSRVSSTPLYDTYINTIFNLSALITSSLLTLIILYQLIIKRKKIDLKNKTISYNIYNIIFLSITTLVYIGSSAIGQTTYSDIRTINIIFLTLIFPFLVIESLKDNLIDNKKIQTILLIFVLLSFPRVMYGSYPKNINDPINVVEDERIARTSYGYAGFFITNYFENGLIIGDYKMNRELNSIYDVNKYDTKLMVNMFIYGLVNETGIPESKLIEVNISKYIIHNKKNTTIAFSSDGTNYPSIYIKKENYIEAIELMYENNCIYNDGQIKMVYNNNPS